MMQGPEREAREPRCPRCGGGLRATSRLGRRLTGRCRKCGAELSLELASLPCGLAGALARDATEPRS